MSPENQNTCRGCGKTLGEYHTKTCSFNRQGSKRVDHVQVRIDPVLDTNQKREEMEKARDELYPPSHNPSTVDVIDVARWDVFEAGWSECRAALAVHENPQGDVDDREWTAVGEQVGAARAGETMWSGPHLKPGERVTVVPKSRLADREKPQSVQFGGLTRIRELANDLYYHAEEAGADLDEIKPIVEEIGGILLSIQLPTRACEDTERPEEKWPRGTTRPRPTDSVQVLMTEEMARRFEAACLGSHTRGFTELAGPMLFAADDLPTYIIGVGDMEDVP